MKQTHQQIKALKGVEKISMLTCYDYSFAKAMNGKVDIILVGDSMGNVVLGFERTKHVLLEDMQRHVAAVRRGAPDTLIVGDLPYGAYDTPKDAIANAEKLVAAGADAVKPEGKPEIVQALTDAGYAVMGHLGLLPQTAVQFGVVGRQAEEEQSLLQAAQDIAKAGAFSVVLECVPVQLADKVSRNISIPTIGIGSGSATDGQVLVLYDMLGLYPDFKPKFVRRYANLAEVILQAVESYTEDVKSVQFPLETEAFK